MIKQLTILLLSLTLSVIAQAAPQGNCSGSPATAVLELPAPLSDWGSIVCTPYGHIISNHDGWIWSYLGAFAPVFIPSQMVRSNPEPIGNKSYFKQITFVEVPLSDKEAAAAFSALNEGLAPESDSKAYKLSVTGSLGRSLTLFFFQHGSSIWGIWCDEHGTQCKSDTRFMVLDMRKGS